MVKNSDSGRPKLAEIHYYAQCIVALPCDGTEVTWVVAISFFFEHPYRVWFGYPVEVWSTVISVSSLLQTFTVVLFM